MRYIHLIGPAKSFERDSEKNPYPLERSGSSGLVGDIQFNYIVLLYVVQT